MTPSEPPHTSTTAERRPRLCEICGRLTELHWHSISTDVDDQEACSAAGGQGYWLCADLCHETVHQKMCEAPDLVGRAGRAVITVMTRAAGIVSEGRRYRRRTATARSPATGEAETTGEETDNGR